MFRSLLRMLKHISFAMIAIIATVCIAEVGMRGHELYQHCQGGAGHCLLEPQPCPVAFQQLPVLTNATRLSTETGEPVEVRTNSIGLRGPEISVPKPAGLFRIVCLGDETTFAPNIAEELTFPAIVNATLHEQSNKSIEVINAGIPGYCPLTSLAWARQRLTNLQPDLVILCCDSSDVDDNRRVRPLARYDEQGRLQGVTHPAVTPRPQNLLQAIEEEFQLAAFIRRHVCDSLPADGDVCSLPEGWDVPSSSAPPIDALHIRQAWEPIAALRDFCDRLSADFVVAIIPSQSPNDSHAQERTESIRMLGEVAEEYGVPYLNVTAEFMTQRSTPLFLSKSGDLSNAGHQLFAELLSWAIVHRDGGPAMSTPSASPITPAAAEEASMADLAQPSPSPPHTLPSTAVPVDEPSPLSLDRRPRQAESADATNADSESVDWSR